MIILRFISPSDRYFEKKYNVEKTIKKKIKRLQKRIKDLLLNTRDRILLEKLLLILTKTKSRKKIMIIIFDINI